ncbi:MAG: hypothetical protein AB8B84_03725 [Granulosicoccus sp.]
MAGVVKESTGLPVMADGAITDPQQIVYLAPIALFFKIVGVAEKRIQRSANELKNHR